MRNPYHKEMKLLQKYIANLKTIAENKLNRFCRYHPFVNSRTILKVAGESVCHHENNIYVYLYFSSILIAILHVSFSIFFSIEKKNGNIVLVLCILQRVLM